MPNESLLFLVFLIFTGAAIFATVAVSTDMVSARPFEEWVN